MTHRKVRAGAGGEEDLDLDPVERGGGARGVELVLEELETLKRFSLSGPSHTRGCMKWTVDQIELGFPVEVHAMGEMAGDTDKLAKLRAIVRELGPELKNIKLAVRLLDERESASAGGGRCSRRRAIRSSAERTKPRPRPAENPITKTSSNLWRPDQGIRPMSNPKMPDLNALMKQARS